MNTRVSAEAALEDAESLADEADAEALAEALAELAEPEADAEPEPDEHPTITAPMQAMSAAAQHAAKTLLNLPFFIVVIVPFPVFSFFSRDRAPLPSRQG